jgi:hypothetical protein
MGPQRRNVLVMLGSAACLAAAPVLGQVVPVGFEFRVNSYTPGYQGLSAAASAPDGRFVVVWTSAPGQDGSAEGIFAQRYDSAGAPAGPEFRVNSYTTNRRSWPSAALAADGRFVVAWQGDGQDDAGGGVFGRRYDSAGDPSGPEFRLNSYTTGTQEFPGAASAADGRFVVVWNSFGQDGSGWGVFGQRYDSAGAPAGPEFRVNSYSTSTQRWSSVASAPDGRFVVVWQSAGQDGSFYGVFGQRYDSAGAPAGPEFRVNSYTTGSQGGAAVALAADGRFVVAWRSADPAPSGVFGQRYDSLGSPLGPEFRVGFSALVASAGHSTAVPTEPMQDAFLAPRGGGRVGFTAAASAADGRFVVAWERSAQDGDGFGVFGQWHDSAGRPSGSAFRANSYTTGAQFGPSVASAADGRFVVTWIDAGQDGSGYGVFGQRYFDDLIFADGFQAGG